MMYMHDALHGTRLPWLFLRCDACDAWEVFFESSDTGDTGATSGPNLHVPTHRSDQVKNRSGENARL